MCNNESLKIFSITDNRYYYQLQSLSKQNLLSYATGDLLDHVVLLVGVTRLPASAAMTTLRFTISAPQQAVIGIPKGTRVKSGEVYFETISYQEVAIGETQVDVIAQCAEEGTKGNGFESGKITELVDVFPFYSKVENITESSGGTDIEDDDSLRQRAFEAPSSFSNAGSSEAYAFWAKTVSNEIGDVGVISPEPGRVQIIPIGKGGELLSEELLEAVLNKCSEEHIKPLTDYIEVIQPNIVKYNINLKYYLESSNKGVSKEIQNIVNQTIKGYINWQCEKLGRDINPSELIKQLMQIGIKRVEIVEPTFTNVGKNELAKVNELAILYGGIEDE